MKLDPVQTCRVMPGDSLDDLVMTYTPPLEEGSVLALSAKVVSLCEGRFVPKHAAPCKQDLVARESRLFLDPALSSYAISLSITRNLLVPCAGIDESNGPEGYILYPENPDATTDHLWALLRKRDKINHLGLVMTDSHTTPLRWGTTGIALSWCGFCPLKSYIGTPDCFGRTMRVSKASHLDGLAAAAVLVMGEGAEQTPFVHIRDVPFLAFQDRPPTPEERSALSIDPADDLYAPLLSGAPWQPGTGPR